MTAPAFIQSVLDGGVSLWLDDLGRERLTSGELQRLVDTQGITGVTTNPSIFAAAVSRGASDYAPALDEAARLRLTAEEAVVDLMVEDVREACSLLEPVHQRAEGRDGFVSLEVDPGLSRDPARTIEQAQHLWDRVDRPNVMIKIPATLECLPAISEVLARGINVNVTLIFGLERYRQVRAAHATGLRSALERGHDISRLASVASFFVSRLDTAVDALIDAQLAQDQTAPERRALLSARRGTAAVLNAHQAYADFRDHVISDEWSLLALRGAIPQRPLWASTGTKDPSYSRVKYVAELLTPGAVNTVPAATLSSLAQVVATTEPTEDGISAPGIGQLEPLQIVEPVAHVDVAAELAICGIDYTAVVTELEEAGVAAFESAWTALLADVQRALDLHGASGS